MSACVKLASFGLQKEWNISRDILVNLLLLSAFHATISLDVSILLVLISYLQVATVTQMVNTSRSMRSFLKGPSNSALVQFSSFSGDQNDAGDGGGIPVFTFWSISSHGMLLFAIFFAASCFSI